MTALNQLYGRRAEPDAAPDDLSLGQLKCLEHIKEAYRVAGDPPDDMSAAGAFAELCGTRAGYSSDCGTCGKPSPDQAEKISLPPHGAVPADLRSVLSGREKLMWEEWRERLLQPDGPGGPEAVVLVAASTLIQRL